MGLCPCRGKLFYVSEARPFYDGQKPQSVNARSKTVPSRVLCRGQLMVGSAAANPSDPAEEPERFRSLAAELEQIPIICTHSRHV